MLQVTITAVRATTCLRQGVAQDCLHLAVADPPESPYHGQHHVIEVDALALAHRMAEYGLDRDGALAAIVREHMQRLCALPAHPSHPWGGLRPDVAVLRADAR